MRRLAILLLAGLTASGCHVSVSELGGSASDEWVRTYQVTPGTEVAISSSNGAIELEGTDGTAVEVRAERTAKATTDEAARDLVARIEIQEDVTPERIAINTEGIGGLLIGVSYRVTYHVRAPHAVVARLRATNGLITVKGFAGHVVAASTNGGVTGEELRGSLDARATNGHVRVGFAAVGEKGITVRTTNGRVDLVLPDAAKGDLTATCRNGSIRLEGLPFEAFGEQTARKVQGKLNGGGAPIELTTVNGGIHIRSGSSSL
jgi:DUF4097 and DUF4098 domain-containing protein YvlB